VCSVVQPLRHTVTCTIQVIMIMIMKLVSVCVYKSVNFGLKFLTVPSFTEIWKFLINASDNISVAVFLLNFSRGEIIFRPPRVLVVYRRLADYIPMIPSSSSFTSQFSIQYHRIWIRNRIAGSWICWRYGSFPFLWDIG
jgi:hypothetical protein